jgi:hypothetical protein
MTELSWSSRACGMPVARADAIHELRPVEWREMLNKVADLMGLRPAARRAFLEIEVCRLSTDPRRHRPRELGFGRFYFSDTLRIISFQFSAAIL